LSIEILADNVRIGGFERSRTSLFFVGAAGGGV
jgi:hypothetical protein